MYQTEDGRTRLDVRIEDDTVWLTQAAMSELYQKDIRTVSEHIKNVFSEGELEEGATIRNYRIVQQEGQRQVSRDLLHYNLDMILAVGYRVKSHRGTQFRRWATERLREYLVKGFAMDDQRLKEGRNLGADYFDELLERIRDIRASEKRFYRKITDIYAMSIDYDPHSDPAKEFFATVQNKLHWATTGHTAAELIAGRADAEKPNMGLTTWKGAKVRKLDVTVAKNYLAEDEIRELNRIVTMYLDYAEDQARRHQPMYMRDWSVKLDAFLQFNERDVLDNPGKISKEVAERLAIEQYERFHARRLASAGEDVAGELDQAGRKLEGKDGK
jgi:hypothetical protein